MEEVVYVLPEKMAEAVKEIAPELKVIVSASMPKLSSLELLEERQPLKEPKRRKAHWKLKPYERR